MPKTIQPARDLWPEATATVTACEYKFPVGRALAFGLPDTRRFHITFNYWAPNPDGTPELHTAQLTSEKAMHVGTLFHIHYNPDAPHQTTRSTTDPHPATGPMLSRNPLLIISILGSVILSLAWLFVLRGCRP